MNTPPPSPITAQPTTNDEDLTGRILRGRVLKTGLDHCDLALIDPETGQEYKRRGRLYQQESLAWKDPALMRDLPAYQPSTPGHPVELPAVYVRHLREVGNERLWFVHERWGRDNPWAAIKLKEDDLVYGAVTHEMTSHRSGEMAGYLVQLDDGPTLTLDGEPDESGRRQPDIEVFIPVVELPWADGRLGTLPTAPDKKRMTLVKGDRVQAMLLDIRPPPQHPSTSITRLINYRDAHSQARQSQWEIGARLRLRLLFGNRVDDGADTIPEQAFLNGVRLLLVDDDERALHTFAELYRLNGAHVETVAVERDHFGAACGTVARKLDEADFDLVMVDNNLPGQGLGERLIDVVALKRRTAENKPLRFLLLTANPLDACISRAKRLVLQSKGVVGFLHRPLSHDSLQKMLAGEILWEEDVERPRGQSAACPNQAPTGSHSPAALLADVAGLPEVHFAMLLRIDPDLTASDCLTAGRAPFDRADLKRVLAGTDLHLLAEGRTNQLLLRPNEGGNADLRVMPAEPARWVAFEVDGERWILGVGHNKSWDPSPYWPWWQQALAARLEEQSWLAWAHESSSFVELGMAHQGLCHEIFNLRNEMEALLQTGEAWLKKPGNDPAFLPSLIGKLRRSHQDTLNLAEHLLEGLSHRQNHVFLPAAMATVRSIVREECKAKNLLLHIAPTPPIALQVPSAALVLPVVNLALNSAKHHYRQENRRVSIVTDVARQSGQAILRVDVRDNGPGLSVPARARLWQPGRSFAAAQQERHGMGLWLSRLLAEEAGGRLDRVEDWSYLGSHFRLSFPIGL